MSNPLERIKRLRADAPRQATWVWTRWCDFWQQGPDHDHAGADCWRWVVYDADEDDPPLLELPTEFFAQHVTALLNAATEQLNQLAHVFEQHARGVQVFTGGASPMGICKHCGTDWDSDPVGCPDYRAALAVLDQLDPAGGEQ